MSGSKVEKESELGFKVYHSTLKQSVHLSIIPAPLKPFVKPANLPPNLPPNLQPNISATSEQPHCKPKPCKAYRELPVSQFSQGKTCFHYREPLFSLQGPCFHYRDFPVNPCTSLLGIAVHYLTCLLLINKKNKTNTSRLLITPNLCLEPLCTSQKYRHSFDFLARAALKLAHYSTWEGEKRLFLHDKLH